jgi:hypothetical protein
MKGLPLWFVYGFIFIWTKITNPEFWDIWRCSASDEARAGIRVGNPSGVFQFLRLRMYAAVLKTAPSNCGCWVDADIGVELNLSPWAKAHKKAWNGNNVKVWLMKLKMAWKVLTRVGPFFCHGRSRSPQISACVAINHSIPTIPYQPYLTNRSCRPSHPNLWRLKSFGQLYPTGGRCYMVNEDLWNLCHNGFR